MRRFRRQPSAWKFAWANLGVALVVSGLAAAPADDFFSAFPFAFGAFPGGLVATILVVGTGLDDSSWHVLGGLILIVLVISFRLACIAPLLGPRWPGPGWLWGWTMMNTLLSMTNGLLGIMISMEVTV